MAINPATEYPLQTTTPDSSYPYGGAQNVATPGDNTGTPWEEALINDIFGVAQKLLTAASITPSGSPETVLVSQYFDALQAMAIDALETLPNDLRTDIDQNAADISGNTTDITQLQTDTTDGTWQTPTLINGWAFGANALRYRLLENGKYLRIVGELSGASATGLTAFQVPAAYRPLPLNGVWMQPAFGSNPAEAAAAIGVDPLGNVAFFLQSSLATWPTSNVYVAATFEISTPF